MKNLAGKVAAVTGASSGMGRALAVELAKQGCHLALSDVNQVGLTETCQLVERSGVKVTSQIVDVARREQMQDWAEQTLSQHGKINLIFNNAGVAQAGTVSSNTFEDYEWVLGINMWGVINGTKVFLPHLKAAGEGHIINTSSIFGLCSQPAMSSYNTSKFAVRGFTESLRQELDIEKCGVSATSVHPGGIDTNICNSARVSDSITALTSRGKATDDMMKNFGKLLKTSPEKAAQAIISGVKGNKRRVLIGVDAHLVDIMQRLFPSFYQAIVVRVFQTI